MALSATSFLAPQFQAYKFYWLKFYEPGTTTPKSIATDVSGNTLIAKAVVNNSGFIETAGGTIFIPFIDGFYDAYLFPTEAAADANDTANAFRIADNINGSSPSDFITPQDFGALGDGVNDDTTALQAWAAVGGRIYLPRGLYRTTSQVTFPPLTSVFGETAGGGTGGGEALTLLAEAAAGASIIYPDVVNWDGSECVFLFESNKVDPDNKATPSVYIQDLKIECPRTGGVAAKLLKIRNSYDSLFISNINLNFAHQDHEALQIIRDGSGIPSVAQTAIIQNVVAIGDDLGAASTTPVVSLSKVYEFQMIGVKSFGGAQALSPTYSNRVPISLEGCNGGTLIGCSSALTANVGLDIYVADRKTDGIAVIGHTFEVCELGGWQIDGETRAGVGITLTNVNIIAPRYEFPQTIAGLIKTATGCRAECSFKEVYVSNDAANNVLTGSRLDRFTSTVGDPAKANSNVYNAVATSDGLVQRSSQNVGVQRSTPSYRLISADGVTGYKLQGDVGDGGVDFGCSIRDLADNPFVVHNANAKGSTQISNAGAGIIFNTPNDTILYEMTIDDDGNPYIVNTVDASDIHSNNDRPFNVAGTTHTVVAGNTGQTIYAQNAAATTIAIPPDASSSIPINAAILCVWEGVGQPTIDADAAVTLNGVLGGSCTIEAQWTGATIVKRGANEYVVSGNISVVA